MSKKNSDEDLGDFSKDEFDEIYSENNEDLIDLDDEESLMSDNSEDELDFVEDDIEEIYVESTDQEGEEIFESDEDEFSKYDNSAPKKKSSFGVILFLLVLIGGGVGAYFSGLIPGIGAANDTRSYETPDPQVQEFNIAVNEAGVSDTDAMLNVETTSTDDLNTLYDESFSDTDQMSGSQAELIEEDGFGFAEEETASNATEELFADDQVVDDVENIKPLQTQAQNQISNVSVQPETNINSAEIELVESKVAQLETQLNNMQQSIEKLSRNMTENIPANSNATNADNNADISALENSISQVRNNLNDMSARFERLEGKLETSLTQMKSSSQNPPKVANNVIEKEIPAVVAVAKKPVAQVIAKATPRVTANSWEIRAIQVGKAVIARKGKGETRDIQVGDSVPGLGNVNDINYKNGGWVIEGSNGTIKQ